MSSTRNDGIAMSRDAEPDLEPGSLRFKVACGLLCDSDMCLCTAFAAAYSSCSQQVRWRPRSKCPLPPSPRASPAHPQESHGSCAMQVMYIPYSYAHAQERAYCTSQVRYRAVPVQYGSLPWVGITYSYRWYNLYRYFNTLVTGIYLVELYIQYNYTQIYIEYR